MLDHLVVALGEDSPEKWIRLVLTRINYFGKICHATQNLIKNALFLHHNSITLMKQIFLVDTALVMIIKFEFNFFHNTKESILRLGLRNTLQQVKFSDFLPIILYISLLLLFLYISLKSLTRRLIRGDYIDQVCTLMNDFRNYHCQRFQQKITIHFLCLAKYVGETVLSYQLITF